MIHVHIIAASLSSLIKHARIVIEYRRLNYKKYHVLSKAIGVESTLNESCGYIQDILIVSSHGQLE